MTDTFTSLRECFLITIGVGIVPSGTDLHGLAVCLDAVCETERHPERKAKQDQGKEKLKFGAKRVEHLRSKIRLQMFSVKQYRRPGINSFS